MWRLGAALASTALAAVAFADPAGAPLAAAGACAEPRGEIQTAPDQAGLLDEFEVAGSPAHHFTPHDVAGDLPADGAATPAPPDLPGRGSCDAPNASCGTDIGRSRDGGPIGEGPAQPGLPPGTTDQTPRGTR